MQVLSASATGRPGPGSPWSHPMTYPAQPGQPGGWPDPSWPSAETYQDPAAAQASPAGYAPYSAQPGYPQAEYPQADYSQQGYPQADYAQQGYAQPGYAQPGYQQPGYAQPYAAYVQPSPPTNGLAVASLVCALSGLLTCGVASIVGAILGHVARKQIAERGGGGDGLALAGVITGWILFAIFAVGWIIYFGALGLALGAGSATSSDYGDVLRTMLSATLGAATAGV